MHDDHCNGIPSIIDRFNVDNAFVNKIFLQSGGKVELLRMFAEEKIKTGLLANGLEIKGYEPAKIRVLNPPDKDIMRDKNFPVDNLYINDSCSVLLIDYIVYRILLCADIGERVDGKEWNYQHESRFKDPIRHDELILEAWKRANETGIEMVVNGKPFIGPEAGKLEEIAQSMKVTPFLEEGDEEWKSEFHTRFHPSLPPCYKPWQEIMIQPTGEVRLCCYYPIRFAIGNIMDNNFFEIWNSEEMVAERKHFLDKGVSPTCHASSPCMRCMPQDK